MIRKALAVLGILVLAQLLLGASCWVNVQPPEDCRAACAHLAKLGCPEGADLPDGTTCLKFCQESVNNGHALNSGCIATATSCERARSECGM